MAPRKITAASLAVLLLLPTLLLAQERPVLGHQALSCVSGDCRNALVVATVTSNTVVDSVRVYFRAEGSASEYYVEMARRGGNEYWGVLPKIAAKTQSITYRVVARDASGQESSTSPVVAPVRANCREVAVTKEEHAAAENMVLGQASDQPGTSPQGFRCLGVVRVVRSNGEMILNDECRQKIASGQDADCKAVPWLWVAGSAAAIGLAVVVEDVDSGPPVPVSTLRPAAVGSPKK